MIIENPLSKFFLYVGVQPGCEKVVIGSNDLPLHLTCMIKRGQGLYEAHLTPQGKGFDKETRDIVFRMPIDDFNRFLLEWNAAIQAIINYYYSQKINLGRMRRYKWVILPIIDDSQKAQQVVKVTKAGKHFRFNEKFDSEGMEFELLCPGCYSQSGFHKGFVYSTRKGRLRRQGVVFSMPQSKGYHYVSAKGFNQMIKELIECTYDILSKYKIERQDRLLQYLEGVYRRKYLINAPPLDR